MSKDKKCSICGIIIPIDKCYCKKCHHEVNKKNKNKLNKDNVTYQSVHNKTYYQKHKNNIGAKEYFAWVSIRNRCFNKSCSRYNNYGGRGITMCERWANSFQYFLSDVGYAPSSKHSADRFPNNSSGNYEPSNFRWATIAEQNRNKRSNVYIEHNGQKFIMADWAKILKIPAGTIKYWSINKGYSIKEIVLKFNINFE